MDLSLIQKEVVVSSVEIAELTGKRHDSVLRDIDTVLVRVAGLHKYVDTYIHPQNKQEYRCYKLPKRETLILVSGYSVELRAKIIDRLEHLEKQNKPALPSYAETLRLYAGEIEKNEALQLEVKENAPKVEFYESVTGSKDTIDLGQVAKVLNIKGYGRNNLFEYLRNKNILMDNNQPYQKFIDRGYFRLVESKYSKPCGSTHINIKTVVYQKGVDYIRKQILKENNK